MAYQIPSSIGSYVMPRRKGAAPRATALAKKNKTFRDLMQMFPSYITPAKKPGTGGGAGSGTSGAGGASGAAGGTPALTPEQQAALIVASQLDPQVKELRRQALMKELSGQAAAESARRAAQAMASFTAGDAARVQAAYTSAGRDIQGVSEGLTGGVGAAAQAQTAEENAKLAALGLNQSVGSQGQGAFEAAQFAGGAIPAANLYTSGAEAFTNAQAQTHVGQYSLLQQGLQAQGASAQEAAEVAAKIADLEATRPGLTQQALNVLNDAALKKQELAETRRHNIAGEKVQTSAANAQIYSLLLDQAKQLTDMTGRLYVVKKGKVVPAGQGAPGSAAGRSATSALIAQNKLDYQKSQDLIKNAQNQAKIDITQQQADTAAARETAYAANLKWHQQHPNAGKKRGSGPNGMSDAEVRQYAKIAAGVAAISFRGKRNPKYVKGGARDKNNQIIPGTTNMYITKPQSAQDALADMIAANVPLTLAYQAIYQYAKRAGSWWANALPWWTPPNQRKGKESPGGPAKGG